MEFGIKDVVALANAGFSRQEIAAVMQTLATPAPAPVGSVPAPAVAPAAVPTPAPALVPDPNPVGAPAPVPAADPFAQLLGQMQSLTSAVQAGNIAGSSQPAVQTADDVLASIINPPKKE